jgi:anion-transporting  ArsA/GET3 family ATPase
MEKVYELSERREYDLVVVDTPPSQHALDFLEAPQRLLEFLDSRIVQLLLHPAFAAGRFGFRLFQRSAHRVLQILERVSGISFLEEISEFLLAFEGMSEGFRERAHHVRALLLGRESAFVLVAGPSSESSAHAGMMLERLTTFGVPLAGVVLNRARVWPDAAGVAPALPEAGADAAPRGALQALFAARFGADFPAEDAARATLDAVRGYASLVRSDERAAQPLRQRAASRGLFFRRVPELPRDVHDLEGLARVAAALFEEADPTAEGGAA